MNRLNDALDASSKLTSYQDIFELPHVTFDQIFAVLGSLMLPLIAPILKNIISELKQFHYSDNVLV